MKRNTIHLTILFISLLLMAGCADDNELDGLFAVHATNPSTEAVVDVPVGVDVRGVDKSFALFYNENEVAFQGEDWNNNGHTDHLFFFTDLAPGETKTFVAKPGNPVEVGEGLTNVSILSGTKPVENRQHTEVNEDGEPTAVILENEMIAFRLMLERSGRIEVIGKSSGDKIGDKAVEENAAATPLMQTRWDIGAGSPAIYNYDTIQPLFNYDSARIHIIAEGPLHSVVAVDFHGVKVRNDSLHIRTIYEIVQGKPWIQVRVNLLSKTDLNYRFGTGLPVHLHAQDFVLGAQKGIDFAYTFGPQSTADDYLGLALVFDSDHLLETHRESDHSHLLLVDPVENALSYRVVATWNQYPENIIDEMEFVEKVRQSNQDWARHVEVEVEYPKVE